jgi:hypothetical protein
LGGKRGVSSNGVKKRILRDEEDQNTSHTSYEDTIIKPSKHCLTKEEEREGYRNIMEYTVCIYGIITTKSPHIIIVY